MTFQILKVQILKTKTFIWSVGYFLWAKNPCRIAVRPLLRGHTISDSKSIVLEKKSDNLLGGAHFETVVYHYSFTLPTGNNKVLAAPLHQQRWRYKVWNHILRCCQSHVHTTVVRHRFVHFSTRLVHYGSGFSVRLLQKQQLHWSNLWEMCTKLCLVTVHKQNTWAGGEPIKNSVLHSSTNDLYRIGPLLTPAAGPFSLLNGFFRDGFDDELASIAHISSTKLP